MDPTVDFQRPVEGYFSPICPSPSTGLQASPPHAPMLFLGFLQEQHLVPQEEERGKKKKSCSMDENPFSLWKSYVGAIPSNLILRPLFTA